MYTENIEQMLIKDSIEKKQAGRGIFARASRKRGFKGSVKLSSDYMTKWEWKKMNGDVMFYNMYDYLENLIDFQHFKLKDRADRIMILSSFLKKFTIVQIANHWKVYVPQVKKIIKDLNIPYNEEEKESEIKMLENESQNEEVKDTEIVNDSESTSNEEIAVNPNILPYETFLDLPKEERMKLFTDYITNIDKRELALAWGGMHRMHRVYDVARFLELSDLVRENTKKFSATKEDRFKFKEIKKEEPMYEQKRGRKKKEKEEVPNNKDEAKVRKSHVKFTTTETVTPVVTTATDLSEQIKDSATTPVIPHTQPITPTILPVTPLPQVTPVPQYNIPVAQPEAKKFKFTYQLTDEEFSGEEIKSVMEGLSHIIRDGKKYIVTISLNEEKE